MVSSNGRPIQLLIRPIGRGADQRAKGEGAVDPGGHVTPPPAAHAHTTALMWLALSLVIVVSFLLYVLCFGASSSGVIGQLHHFLTASVGGCLRSVLGKCFGKRCFACMEKVEDYCCWRPNPFLQLFYLGLMAGGFALYWMHSCPLMPNPRSAVAAAVRLGLGLGLGVRASMT